MGNAYGCLLLKKECDIYALDKLNTDNISVFSLNNYKTICKVVDVYDGDTCTIVFKWEGKYRKFKCRCNGYDSPEMKPRLNVENREEVIKKAKQAKSRLQTLTRGVIRVKCLQFDKYGRLLVELFNENTSINNIMINEGHGYIYHGGTKHFSGSS